MVGVDRINAPWKAVLLQVLYEDAADAVLLGAGSHDGNRFRLKKLIEDMVVHPDLRLVASPLTALAGNIHS